MRLEDRDKCNQGGFDLARRIKRANQNCQIIILTGYADENSTRDALVDIQVADVLFKHPFEPHNLRIAVAEAIMTAIGEEDPVDLGDPEDVQLDSVRILHLSDLHFGANHIFQDSSSFPSRDIPTLRKVLMRSLRRHQNEPDRIGKYRCGSG
jgi:response regulator RpfG family c-di-GMP phosphodiesterase